MAQASILTFIAERGEFFQVEVDGQTINRTASNYVRVNHVRPGKHYVELRVRGRHGVYKMGQKVFVPDGVEANYGVRTRGRSGQAYLQLISEVPLAPPVVVVPPLPRYPDYRRYDDRYDPVPPKYEDNYYGSCRNLLSSRELDRLMETIRSRDFESTKLSIARDAIRNSSLMAEDLKRLLQQFEYESTKVEFARYAYEYVCDKEHFYYIYDIFRFDSSVRELEEYTSRRR
ncbi:hypothetical protein GCM10028895_35470 [Pontibacter rugosus]